MLQDLERSFEIDSACFVDEAFKKLSAGQYGVVVSDYEMPKKNGLQFLKELREQNNEVPFILFTGKGGEEVAIGKGPKFTIRISEIFRNSKMKTD